MNLLTLENVSKQFSERLLLDAVSLAINAGERIGLLGVNGSGKTTLLRIIAGQEAPDDGHVIVWGGVRVEMVRQEPALDEEATVLDQLFRGSSPQMRLLRDYESASQRLEQDPTNPTLQQRLMELSAEMERGGGWAAAANAKSILTKLGVSDFDASVGSLSGGQRKRVALARALIDRADLLILDEPTNHIDVETIEWLEAYLITTPGALLMVTHDRHFLDRVVDRIVELDRRQLVSYDGNYSRYLELRQMRHERLASEERTRQKLLKRELEWIRRTPMARGTKQKARRQRIAELQRIHYDAGTDRVVMALATRRLGKTVLTTRGLTKSYDGGLVVKGIDFSLEPGDRIGLLGPNGAGKSTFLDMLAGKVQADAGQIIWGETARLGYYDQQTIDLHGSQRLIEFIEAEASLIQAKDGSRVEATQILEWFLFPRKMQWGRIGSLSGGERRRLYLLRTLIHQPNVLLLDEPTNDLDVQTLAVLEEFLDAFSGCLLVASHDRYFLDRAVDFILPFEHGHLGKRYPAPYDTYRQLRAQDEETVRADRSQEADAATRKARGHAIAANGSGFAPHSGARNNRERPTETRQKLTWNEKQELAQLESQIVGWEKEKARLQRRINDSGSDYQRLQTLSSELMTVEMSLESAFERWAELAERQEA